MQQHTHNKSSALSNIAEVFFVKHFSPVLKLNTAVGRFKAKLRGPSSLSSARDPTTMPIIRVSCEFRILMGRLRGPGAAMAKRAPKR